MNVKRRHLDFYSLVRGLSQHFPPGCWGVCDYQRVYIGIDHPIHVPVGQLFFIKGKVWKVVQAEYIPQAWTLRVSLLRILSKFDAPGQIHGITEGVVCGMFEINAELAR